jgi:hypothetical protein
MAVKVENLSVGICVRKIFIISEHVYRFSTICSKKISGKELVLSPAFHKIAGGRV